MVPCTHSFRCAACQTELRISAIRDRESRPDTTFTVCCPACHNDVQGVIPLSIMLASLQIVSFERPAKGPRVRA